MAEKTPKPDPAARPTEGVKSAFDVWLDRGLHRMFDEVAQEPIPEELLKLIEADRKK